jgi:hypothetical protein
VREREKRKKERERERDGGWSKLVRSLRDVADSWRTIVR